MSAEELEELRAENARLSRLLEQAELERARSNDAVGEAYKLGLEDGKAGQIPLEPPGEGFWYSHNCGTA